MNLYSIYIMNQYSYTMMMRKECENMTKACVTSQGNDLDAPIDLRFGRCSYFVIVDTESMEIAVLNNDAAASSHGAGIQAAQRVVSSGVDVVITGHLGPNAFPALKDAGISVLTAPSGTVRDAINAFKEGTLRRISAPGPAHMGIGRGMGRGRRGSGGRGRGGF